ncbi:c-type cytochrome [Sphingomonas quercus]|uniref:Cytochrome c n=1 Tax=Sphingomonas quercus TaxID=2842451 RepID=A0ABS6BJY3_9SPHN|nr:cytochrome c [Sphingomonas quercus]MBU3078599.1 cytochrome c [Sphingomonas quercus]
MNLPPRRRTWLAGLALAAIPALALAAPATVWDGAYSEAQAKRGEAQYTAHCASCHGDNLAGADVAPPLAGGGFLSNWSGQSAGDLFTRIKTTMPQDNPGSLGSAAVADVEAYILSKNGFPAGSTELPRDASLLGQTKIVPDRPGA